VARFYDAKERGFITPCQGREVFGGITRVGLTIAIPASTFINSYMPAFLIKVSVINQISLGISGDRDNSGGNSGSAW